MTCRHDKDAAVAAAKSGFSRATGYRIENERTQPCDPSRARRVGRCNLERGAGIELIFARTWNNFCALKGTSRTR